MKEDTEALCKDCGLDVAPQDEESGTWHWYMVHDHVWLQSGLGKDDGYLCVPCLEARIGRLLSADDFPRLPINNPDHCDTRRLAELKEAAQRTYAVKATTNPHDHQGGILGPGSFYAVSMPWRMLHAELSKVKEEEFDPYSAGDMFGGAVPLILENECVECWQKMGQILLGIIVDGITEDSMDAWMNRVEMMVAQYISLGEKLDSQA